MGRERLLDLVVVDAQQGADGRELLAPGHAQAEPHERVGLGQPDLHLVQLEVLGGPPPVDIGGAVDDHRVTFAPGGDAKLSGG